MLQLSWGHGKVHISHLNHYTRLSLIVDEEHCPLDQILKLVILHCSLNQTDSVHHPPKGHDDDNILLVPTQLCRKSVDCRSEQLHVSMISESLHVVDAGAAGYSLRQERCRSPRIVANRSCIERASEPAAQSEPGNTILL
jgi:hypothetical protein